MGWCCGLAFEDGNASCPCMNWKKTSRARARSIGLWTKAECVLAFMKDGIEQLFLSIRGQIYLYYPSRANEDHVALRDKKGKGDRV